MTDRPQAPPPGAASAAAPVRSPLDTVARGYVQVVLAVGRHDAAYVDAYYGPPEWREQAERDTPSLAAIDDQTTRLIDAAGAQLPAGDELAILRHQFLVRQLQAVRTRVRMLSGATLSFDEESAALYDAVAPVHTEAHFAKTLANLSDLLPGDAPVLARYEAFRERFVIPQDRLAAVFERAIAESRARTLAHAPLPEGESFSLGYVTNKSWSGYNWYQGGFHSLIQLNVDLPIYIDRAVDLAFHEGYPGHHVYNALLEQHLVRERGWIELTVYPLFSPQSLIAEGTANFGIEVALPGDERAAFERDVLFPLAGLDVGEYERFRSVATCVERLSYAGNEAARRYLDGDIDRASAVDWLMQFALMSRARAEQRTRFMDDFRSYVINYNLGQDLVRGYIERRGGTADNPARRWELFIELLRSPRLPSGLQ